MVYFTNVILEECETVVKATGELTLQDDRSFLSDTEQY